MKSFTICATLAALFASQAATEASDFNNQCLLCLDQRASLSENYYCISGSDAGACQYAPRVTCSSAERVGSSFSCVNNAPGVKSTGCDEVNTLKGAFSTRTITVEANKACYVQFTTTADTTLEFTYTTGDIEVYDNGPNDAFDSGNLLASGSQLTKTAGTAFKVGIANYDTSASKTVTVTNPNGVDPSPQTPPTDPSASITNLSCFMTYSLTLVAGLGLLSTNF